MGEANSADGEMQAKALVSQVSGDGSVLRPGHHHRPGPDRRPGDWSTKAGDLALVYDWCYARLSPAQRTTFIDYFNAWGDDIAQGRGRAGLGQLLAALRLLLRPDRAGHLRR